MAKVSSLLLSSSLYGVRIPSLWEEKSICSILFISSFFHPSTPFEIWGRHIKCTLLSWNRFLRPGKPPRRDDTQSLHVTLCFHLTNDIDDLLEPWKWEKDYRRSSRLFIVLPWKWIPTPRLDDNIERRCPTNSTVYQFVYLFVPPYTYTLRIARDNVKYCRRHCASHNTRHYAIRDILINLLILTIRWRSCHSLPFLDTGISSAP